MVQYLMMRQVLQNYRTGEVWVEEVPAPALRSGAVLVIGCFFGHCCKYRVDEVRSVCIEQCVS
jgi:hypothetical protein